MTVRESTMQSHSNSEGLDSVRKEAQPVEEEPSTQAIVRSNSCGGANQVVTRILEYNVNRKSMIIFNDTAQTLYISYGESRENLSITAGVRSFSESVAAGGKTTGPDFKYTGPVFAILGGVPLADAAVRITEFV